MTAPTHLDDQAGPAPSGSDLALHDDRDHGRHLLEAPEAPEVHQLPAVLTPGVEPRLNLLGPSDLDVLHQVLPHALERTW